MMAGKLGRPLALVWAPEDTAVALQRRWRRERDAQLARRPPAGCARCAPATAPAAAAPVGVEERTVGVWLRWYRAGGLSAVLQHRQAGKGRAPRLNAEQQAALHAHLCSGAVVRAQDAITWVQAHYQVTYQPKGLYSLLHRLKARPKVPRPHNPQSTPEQHEAWTKGGSPTRSRRPASR